MNTTRHAALAQLSARAARPNGRRIMHLHGADPVRKLRGEA